MDRLLVRLEEQKNQNAADDLTKQIQELPSLEELTADDQEKLVAVRAAYDKMTDAQKEKMSADDIRLLEELEAKMATLVTE